MIINPKIKYICSNTNYIPELQMSYSVVIDGEFQWNVVNILVNHKCGASVYNVALLEPLI